jgi:hypothetical protein
MESLDTNYNAPVLLDDLGFFLIKAINCLYGDDQENSLKCANLYLQIISCLGESVKHELTMKYCSMRLYINDIEFIGLSVGKELIEISLDFAKTINDKINLSKLLLIIINSMKSKLLSNINN